VNRQQSSGLTIAQFCAQEQCAKSAFYRWKRHFELAKLQEQCTTRPSPATFLPVAVRLVDRNADHPAAIEADLPNGIRLRIPTTDTRLVCRVVRAIAGARTGSGGPR
jgi:hypothetical protein